MLPQTNIKGSYRNTEQQTRRMARRSAPSKPKSRLQRIARLRLLLLILVLFQRQQKSTPFREPRFFRSRFWIMMDVGLIYSRSGKITNLRFQGGLSRIARMFILAVTYARSPA